MLTKYEKKCFNSYILNDRTFVTHASSAEIFDFLSDTNKTLRQCQIEVSMSRVKSRPESTSINPIIENSLKELSVLAWKDKKEAEQLLLELEKLLVELEAINEELRWEKHG